MANFIGKLYESCMGSRAACMHTTTTKEEEDRSGDSTGCLIFAITRRTSDWLDRIRPKIF
jgi:hypothetical protein